MKINSPRFGELEVDPDRIIEFENGLIGFEDCHRYFLLHPEGENPNYFILQSADDVDLAFYIADPSQFGFSYEIALSDADEASLELKRPDQAAVMVILFKDEDPVGTPLRANLNAPLVINPEGRKGLQHTFARLFYTVEQDAP